MVMNACSLIEPCLFSKSSLSDYIVSLSAGIPLLFHFYYDKLKE